MSSANGHWHSDVVLRHATEADSATLRRLAELDSAAMPEGPVLLAEVDGAVRAAWSLSEKRAIADPFHPTSHLVGLLSQAASVRADTRAGRAAGRLGGLLPGRRAPWPA